MACSVNRKEALLRAARDLFGELGYVETTFKKISERAGVALGLLTHHYGNKEKLFLACGLDVLEHFEKYLQTVVKPATNGFDGVMLFCQGYLDFSIDKDSSWLVLVRCSPYSDMKTNADRDLMDSRFTRIHSILVEQLQRGMEDGSLQCKDADAMAQVIMSLLVGANRTMVLTPYGSGRLYKDTLEFVARALGNASLVHMTNRKEP